MPSNSYIGNELLLVKFFYSNSYLKEFLISIIVDVNPFYRIPKSVLLHIVKV